MKPFKSPTLGNGKICYLEIPAMDVDLSAEFYKACFGWSVRQRDNGSVAFDDALNEVSGTWVTGRKSSPEPGLIVSIMVEDVADTLEVIKANRGAQLNYFTMGETEAIGWFSDPAGNLVGLYQHPGGGHGKICYLEIPADDISASVAFYEAVFNWPIRKDDHGGDSFDDGVGVVSGMWTENRKPSTEPGLLIYIMMDNVAETLNAIKAAGGIIVQPIGMHAPEITARFSDPFGNVLGLYQNPD